MRLTKEDESIIIDKYNNGSSMEDITNNHGYAFTTIKNILVKHNVPIRSRSESKRKYTLNEDYFETIDSPIKAYFLGFIAADGNIEECKGYNRFSLHLSHIDGYLLDKLKDELNYTGTIYNIKPTKSTPKGAVRLKISSQKLCDDLGKYGIVPRKSLILQYPTLSDELQSHFIRGYLDGDGWISKPSGKVMVGFCSGSKDFLTDLEKILKQKLNLKDKNLHLVDGCYTLQYGAKEEFKTIGNYLYKDSTFHLDRKYTKLN